MICPTCRAAADFAAEAEVIYQYLDGRPQEMLSGADAARNMHGACREAVRQEHSGLSAVELAASSWCDCQHVIPILAASGPLTLDM
jgi:hypothetical protein